MDALVQGLEVSIDYICGAYHCFKSGEVLNKARVLAGKIQEFCSIFLQGNIFEVEESEYQILKDYVVQVLDDYMEAIEQRDIVLMLDTLDYGLRELLDIYNGDTEAEENGDE